MKGSRELEILNDIAQTNVDPALYDFEQYCGSCDNFPGNADVNKNILCPFRNVVNKHTEWKKLGCQYFWD